MWRRALIVVLGWGLTLAPTSCVLGAQVYLDKSTVYSVLDHNAQMLDEWAGLLKSKSPSRACVFFQRRRLTDTCWPCNGGSDGKPPAGTAAARRIEELNELLAPAIDLMAHIADNSTGLVEFER